MRVSAMEQGDVRQLEVSTLQRYVGALGGKLRIVADFADHDVTVSSTQKLCLICGGGC